VTTSPDYTLTTSYAQLAGQDRSLLGIALTFCRGKIKLPTDPWKTWLDQYRAIERPPALPIGPNSHLHLLRFHWGITPG